MTGAESYQWVHARITIHVRNAGDRLRVRRWLPPLLWAGVIVFATSVPTTFVPPQLSPFDKAIHFSMYAVLAALLAWYVLENRKLLPATILSLVLVAAFGAADEWHQRFIPGRSSEFADWVADSLGGVSGVVAAAFYTRRQGRSVR